MYPISKKLKKGDGRRRSICRGGWSGTFHSVIGVSSKVNWLAYANTKVRLVGTYINM